MNKKIPCLLLAEFILSALTLSLGYCYPSNATVPFKYNELSSQLYIYSPAKNSTYSDSDIMINASLFIGSHESEPDTHYIPYQNISCVYSLDDSEWQDMSLISVYIHEPFCSHVNPFWYSTADLNYSATLHGLSEGEHHLQFSIKPDSIYFMVIHEQDRNYSTRYQDYLYFSVNAVDQQGTGETNTFTGPNNNSTQGPASINNPESTATSEPKQGTSLWLPILVSVVSVAAVVAVAALVYWKKRKH